MEPLTHQNSFFCWKQFFPNCKFWKIYLRLEGVRTSNATVLVGCVLAQALTGSVILGRFLHLLSFWSPCSLPSACYVPAYALEKLISPLAHKLHSLCLLSRLNFFIKKKNPPCLSHVDEIWRPLKVIWARSFLNSCFESIAYPIQSLLIKSLVLYMYFLSSSVGKRTCLQCRGPGFDTWVGKYPGEGNGNPPSTLASRIPWTEEPGGLQSMASQRDGHDCATNFLSSFFLLCDTGVCLFVCLTLGYEVFIAMTLT